MWQVDDTQLTAKLPDQPPPNSYVTVTTATGTQEWSRTAAGWVQVDDATQTVHDWPFVVAQDTGGRPQLAFTPLDRDDVLALIQRIKMDGASVQTVEGTRLRCVSDPANNRVTAQFGANTQHLSRRATARFAIGLLGSLAALIGQGQV
jgi:hypothetical protein